MSGTIDGGAHSDFVDFHFEGNDEMEDGRPWLAEPPGALPRKVALEPRQPGRHAVLAELTPSSPSGTGAGVGETVFHPEPHAIIRGSPRPWPRRPPPSLDEVVHVSAAMVSFAALEVRFPRQLEHHLAGHYVLQQGCHQNGILSRHASQLAHSPNVRSRPSLIGSRPGRYGDKFELEAGLTPPAAPEARTAIPNPPRPSPAASSTWEELIGEGPQAPGPHIASGEGCGASSSLPRIIPLSASTTRSMCGKYGTIPYIPDRRAGSMKKSNLQKHLYSAATARGPRSSDTSISTSMGGASSGGTPIEASSQRSVSPSRRGDTQQVSLAAGGL